MAGPSFVSVIVNAMKNLALLAALLGVGCSKKSDHPSAGSGADALAQVAALKDRLCACKDKDCATKVHAEYVQWGLDMTKSGTDQRPDEAMAKKMTEVSMAYGDCLAKSMSAGPVVPSPPAPAEATGQQADPIPFSGSTGIPECDDYKATVDKLAACDKLPAATRSIMKDSLGQAMLAIRSLPADGKQSAATACVMGADGIKQSARAVGCDVGTK
ncbi:hypothetical protein BH11MYX2_BH11MYX2_09490 [soil metagenome]